MIDVMRGSIKVGASVVRYKVVFSVLYWLMFMFESYTTSDGCAGFVEGKIRRRCIYVKGSIGITSLF